MTASLSDLHVSVHDLLDRPGASREVDLALPVPDDFGLPLATVDEPVALSGVIESVVDGLLVRGVVDATVGLVCARCLASFSVERRLDVVEMFADPSDLDPADELDAGYELSGEGLVHLGALLRDALSAVIPYRPLCREDCRGLCAQCGADRNEVACDCVDDAPDPRWEALRGLRLPE